jgi:rubrerythrin
MSTYDSRTDTEQHIQRVQSLMAQCIEKLTERSRVHDRSKLSEPEKSAFDYATPLLKGSTYGSDEYKGFLAELKPALDHHYVNNSHHPEHYRMWKCPACNGVYREDEITFSECYEGKPAFCPKCCPQGSLFEAQLEPTTGIEGMSLLDLVEMLCDWKAAGERHANGSIERSLVVNRERFQLSEQLTRILSNSARELGWVA